MRAAICREFNAPLSLENVSISEAKGHEIKVRIEACAICHSDISYLKGYWGGTPPIVFGHEAAGVITETGEDTSGFKVGDRVIVTLMRSCGSCPSCGEDLEAICATPPAITAPALHDEDQKSVPVAMNSGAFAEQVLVHERQCIAIPDDVDFNVASLLGCGVITGFGAVTRVGKVKQGETVIITGTGGVGINAIQAARIAGAAKIIAIDIADDKEDLVRRLGATDFINPMTSDAQEAVMAITEGKGADAAFVAVGASAAITAAVPMIRAGGRVVIMGMPASDDLVAVDASDLAGSAKSVIGTKMGSAMIREDIPMLIALYQKGELELDGLISHHFNFDQINEAIEVAATPSSLRVVVHFAHDE